MRLSVAVALLFIAACSRAPSRDAVDRAEFGIFFGGQVQERAEIPFELDVAKQSQGFRLEFAKPVQHDTPIEWALGMPRAGKKSRGKQGSGKRADAGAEYATSVGRATVRAGERRFEQVLHFKPGDPLGLWNIRVVVGTNVLLDRPFTVYDPDARARAARDGGQTSR